MTQKSGPPPIVFIVLFLALIGGGYWFFFLRSSTPSAPGTATSPTNPAPASNSPFGFPTSVPQGTTVRIDGSTSMVTINQNLKRGFEAKFPGTSVTTIANGSDVGIQTLLKGGIDVAAVSRPLSAQEQSQGLAAVSVSTDTIAIVVGSANPFNNGLTSAQVMDIFQGKVNNWSVLGGKSGTIRVINRPEISGTRQAFQELVLRGANFGTAPNFTTLATDGSTILFQALGTDGIGYATFAQAAKQQTVRTVAIDGLTPDASSYPYQRQLYYVYKNPASPAVQAFLGYATSPLGQQAVIIGN
jgi:phosphate transport system substrate-binding protein